MSADETVKGTSELPRPVIAADECKSCGRCVAACPRQCLRVSDRLNRRGVRPVEYAGQGCTGCAVCFYNCPEPYVLTIETPEAGSAREVGKGSDDHVCQRQ